MPKPKTYMSMSKIERARYDTKMAAKNGMSLKEYNDAIRRAPTVDASPRRKKASSDPFGFGSIRLW
ncbi:MAG: hypothetical protein EHM25_11925 [Nitrosopumilales archaeon]|nr:MAG: hypothetical protein EHM25_11925 [Nitrosopumilales archaeon]